MKRVKFGYLGTVPTIIDLYRLNTVEGRRFKNTYIKRPKMNKINQEVPQQSLKDNVQVHKETFEYYMEALGSDPEEFDVVSILDGLHEGREKKCKRDA